MYKKIRKIAMDFRPKTRKIRKGNGSVVWYSQKVLES